MRKMLEVRQTVRRFIIITLDCQRSNAEKTIIVNNVFLCILSKTATLTVTPGSWTSILTSLCTLLSPAMMTDWSVDAVKDYETDTAIIKISALPAVRLCCGHSVVLAANIITG